jgi:hypothetical protein
VAPACTCVEEGQGSERRERSSALALRGWLGTHEVVVAQEADDVVGGRVEPEGRPHTDGQVLESEPRSEGPAAGKTTAGGAEVSATGRGGEVLQRGLVLLMYVPFGGVPRQISPQAVLPLDL